VDTNCMSHDIDALMCCDASVIPNHISSNPNSMIMSIASRASEFVITDILGKSIQAEYHVNVESAPSAGVPA